MRHSVHFSCSILRDGFVICILYVLNDLNDWNFWDVTISSTRSSVSKVERPSVDIGSYGYFSRLFFFHSQDEARGLFEVKQVIAPRLGA